MWNPFIWDPSCEGNLQNLNGWFLSNAQEEYSKGKELMRTCEDDVDMSKCEGYCVSTTAPSAMDKWVTSVHFKSLTAVIIITRSGFSKDCNCCRESGYRERTITLQSCYDQVRLRCVPRCHQMSWRCSGRPQDRVRERGQHAGHHQGAQRLQVLQVRLSPALD